MKNSIIKNTKIVTILAGLAFLAITAANLTFARSMVCDSYGTKPEIFDSSSMTHKSLVGLCGSHSQANSMKAQR